VSRLRRSVAAVSALRGDGRGWLLLSVALGWFFVLGVRFLIPAILPQIRAEFGVDKATAGVAVTLVWACYGVAQFPAGALVNRVGERTLLAGGLFVGGVALAALALSPVFAVFLAGCVLFGAGTGFYGPARGTVLSNTFTRRAGVAFGLTLATGSLGSALFPFVAGALVETLGWRRAVALALPLAVVVSGMLYRFVPARSADADPLSVADVREALGPAVRNRGVVVASLAVTFMLFSFQGLTAFLPTYFIEAKSLPQSTGSALFALLFLAGAGFQLLGGTGADRYGSRAVLVAIAAVSALSLAALPFVGGVAPLALLTVALGVRLAIVPVTNAYVLAALPAAVQGTAWGLVRTVFFLLGASGSTFVGVLADAGLFDEAFLALAALNAVAAALYLLLPADADAASA
jgi:predicted MFS family arabinose efflux permease